MGSSADSDVCHKGSAQIADAPEISIVVPVANGASLIAASLAEVGAWLRSQGSPGEIVVVDDGSTDGTAEVVAAWSSTAPVPVTMLHHTSNRGKGEAVRTGMQAARGRYRVFIDADLAYPPAEIGRLLDELRRGADVAIASRVHPESRYLIRPTFFRYLYTRHIAGRVFNWLVRLVLLPKISDTQAGLKGFSAAAAESLFGGWAPSGFGFDLAILARARRARLKVVEVPVTFRYDQEPTTMRFIADTVGMLRDIAAVRLRVGHGGAIASAVGESRPPSPAEARGWRPPWVVLAALVVLLAGVEVARSLLAPLLVPLAVWVACLGVWLCYTIAADRRAGVPRTRWFVDWREAAVVAGITAFAAALRITDLASIPAFIHQDAAACGLVARDMLTGVSRDPFALSSWWYDVPQLGLLPHVITLKLLGTSVLSLRLASAIPGVLVVPAFYFLVRGWFDRLVASIAAVLLAANHVAVHFARSGIWNVDSLLVGFVALGALFAGWRRRSGAWLAISGIAAGLSLYTYTAGRLFFGLTLLMVPWLLLRHTTPPVRRLAASFVVALLATLSPLVGSYARHPQGLQGDRLGTVSVFGKAVHAHVVDQVGSAKPLRILWYQVRHTLGGFATEGDSSSNYGTDKPLIGRATLVLALIGVGLALARLPDARFTLLLAWLGFGLLFGGILAINPPSFPRLLAVVPVPIVLAAAVLGKGWDRAARLGPVLRGVAAAVVVVAAGVSLVANARDYLAFCRASSTSIDEWEVVEAVQLVPHARTIYLFTGPEMLAESPSFELFREGRRFVFGLTAADLPEHLKEPTAFILVPPYLPVGLSITERFPGVHKEEVKSHGMSLVAVYSWGGARAAQGGQR
jgi:dolichyl-phosphate beta-glucosyltransferase